MAQENQMEMISPTTTTTTTTTRTTTTKNEQTYLLEWEADIVRYWLKDVEQFKKSEKGHEGKTRRSHC